MGMKEKYKISDDEISRINEECADQIYLRKLNLEEDELKKEFYNNIEKAIESLKKQKAIHEKRKNNDLEYSEKKVLEIQKKIRKLREMIKDIERGDR